MRTRSGATLVATLALASLLVALPLRSALADAAVGPRHRRPRCTVRRFQQPNEQCLRCRSLAQEPARCVAPLERYGFHRRCREARRVATEVWCRDLTPDTPTVPPEVLRVLTDAGAPIVLPPEPLPATDGPLAPTLPLVPNPPLPPLRTDDTQPTPAIPMAPAPPAQGGASTTTVLSEEGADTPTTPPAPPALPTPTKGGPGPVP